MNRTKILCALLCGVLTLSLAACGKTAEPAVTEPETVLTTGLLTTAPAISERESTEQTAESGVEESPEASTEAADTVTEPEESSTEKAELSLESGLNSTDVSEVLAFYQLAAAKNDVKQYTKTLELISLDGGEGKVGSYVSVFEPIARKAIAKNSVTGDVLPGKYKTIRPSDWQSASAVSDGTYTTIRVQVAPQTDGADGREFDGSCGRSMTVLNGVQMAVDEMPGVSADCENGKVSVEYLNPSITVKVDNRTGKFVPGSCRWYYRVHPLISSLDAKVLAFNVHLQNAEGYIDYTMSY